MKYFKLFFFLFLSQNLHSQFKGYTPSLSVQSTEIYKNSNIYQQDFLYLCEGLKKFHANVFLNFPKEEYNKAKETSYKQLANCNNESEFGFIANKFTNKIRDGHTGVKVQWEGGSNNIYPFRCKYLVDSLVIMAVSDQLPFSLCGEKIKSINGISIKEIEKKALETYVTENYVSLQKSIMLRINSTEYLRFIEVIQSDTSKIKIFTYSGKEFVASPNFNGKWKSQIPSQNPNFKPFITERQFEPFLYKIDKERKLCYIQFNKMVDKKVGEMYIELLPFLKRWFIKTIRFFGASGGFSDVYFEDFLNSCLEEIEKNNIKKVVVDLRWNTGGSMTLGSNLLYAFGVDKYKSYSSEINRSELFNLQMEDMGIDVNEFNNEDTSDGFYYTKAIEETKNINKRFKGDVYFITSEWTFSSAVQLATIVKDNGLFKVVGEPTSGRPTHFGEVLFLKLPNTSIVCSLSSKLFHRPDNLQDNKETLYPDVTVYKTYNDIINGIDRVYEWIAIQ